MTSPTASFLLPPGFTPPGRSALLRELRAVTEGGRAAARVSCGRRGTPAGSGSPVLLVPGFLAGDATLAALARHLRREGFRTYRSTIHANVSCTARTARLVEARLESVVERRGERVQIVGHSLGGMLARGLAVRRPDLVAGIITLGSPVLAPGAHHPLLARQLGLLVQLARHGVPQVMSAECVAGDCALDSFTEMRSPVPDEVSFTAIWSRRDGVVDWRACLDPEAVHVEVSSSHIGMAFDPRTRSAVTAALHRHGSVGLEDVDGLAG